MRFKVGWLPRVMLGAVFLASCEQGDQRLKDKAALEASEAARKQLEAQHLYLKQRSQEMEADLSRRQRFYKATSGIYEGRMSVGSAEPTKIRFTFTPSLPPYNSERVRAIEEVVYDLNNLYFNVHVVQWDDGGVAFGCVFQNVRPNLNAGKIELASSDCTSVYSIGIAEDEGMPSKDDFVEIFRKSEVQAGAVLEGRLDQVVALKGYRQATRGAGFFNFAVVRAQP